MLVCFSIKHLGVFQFRPIDPLILLNKIPVNLFSFTRPVPLWRESQDETASPDVIYNTTSCRIAAALVWEVLVTLLTNFFIKIVSTLIYANKSESFLYHLIFKYNGYEFCVYWTCTFLLLLIIIWPVLKVDFQFIKPCFRVLKVMSSCTLRPFSGLR